MIKEEIKKRIGQINSGQVPEGYKKEHGFIAPKEWEIPTISKIVKAALRPVDKPKEGYWRLGLRSHAKGTFHTFVENPETVAMDELYEVKENDLVLNITFAWEHAIAVANKEDEGKLVSHRFPTYEFKSDSVANFYKYVIVQPRLKEMLANISPGGAGRNRVLNKTDFLKLNLPKPPKKEQQNIAEILATCNRVIELKENLLTEKQNQKKWLMQKLLTGKIRLKGFNREWKEYCLNDIGSLSKGCGVSKSEVIEEGIPCIRYGEIYTDYNFVIKEFKSFISDESAKLSKLMKYGDILFAGSGETAEEIGKAVAYIFDTEAYAGGDIIILSPDKLKVDSRFLSYIINTGDARLQLNKLAQGNSVVHIYPKNIAELKVTLPSFEEQYAIAEIFTIIDKEIDLLQKEIDEYKMLKKSLMQLLLTGVVRVNKLEINSKPQEKQEVQAC